MPKTKGSEGGVGRYDSIVQLSSQISIRRPDGHRNCVPGSTEERLVFSEGVVKLDVCASIIRRARTGLIEIGKNVSSDRVNANEEP